MCAGKIHNVWAARLLCCVSDLLPNLSLVSSWQDLQVGLQSTAVESLGVPQSLHRLSEEDVALNGGILDPRLLWDVRHLTLWVGVVRQTLSPYNNL